MHLRPVIARIAVLASAFALFAGSVLFARFAMADGREGRPTRPPTPPAAQEQTYVPTTPDIPELAGAQPDTNLSAAGAGIAPCMSTEEAYFAISQATEGADIETITAALAEVESDPIGVNSDPSAPSLANRLRATLGLNASAPPCDTVLAALADSLQLAQIASAAIPGGPVTGGIGDPPPTSPSYRPVPIGTISGARGHGYCTNLSDGCS